MEKELKILKALSHQDRMAIVYALENCDYKCVCELQELEELNGKISQSSLSQHLKILRDAEIVITKKEGGWVHYSLKNKNIIKILNKIKEI